MIWRIHVFPRYKLIRLPTPLEKASRLGKELGIELYVKRDDVMELALGGNKVRKLEYFLGDAITRGRDILITKGAYHSNHARLTAAAARKAGFDAILVLYPPGTKSLRGNLLLDKILGAEIVFAKDSEEADRIMEELSEELRGKGRKPYIIPGGGASPLGVLGYINASLEILQQLMDQGVREPDYIVLATGTGATQAGLILGLKMLGAKTRVVGISVGRSAREEKERILSLVNDTIDFLGAHNINVDMEDVVVFDNYTFGGYGAITREVIETIEYIARMEGLILDPVYTGKAMYGLLDLVSKSYIRKGDKVVFLHTGGIPILFQYDNIVAEYF